jgi:hypothetical protein
MTAPREVVADWRFHWAAQRKLWLGAARAPASLLDLFAAALHTKNIGYAAALGLGFRQDGSLVREPVDQTRFVDRERPPILERIARETQQFVRPKAPSSDQMRAFIEGITRLKALDVEVVVYAPPLCSEARATLEADRQWGAWLDDIEAELTTRLGAQAVRFHAFATPASLGKDDRSMLDCFHGDPALGQRMVERVFNSHRRR